MAGRAARFFLNDLAGCGPLFLLLGALWERFGLMNQSKISVDLGSFSVPAVLRLFSAQIPTVQRNRSSVLLNFLD